MRPLGELLTLDEPLPQDGPSLTERFTVWFRNLRSIHIRIALRILCRAMQRDKSYRDSWQANIAMPIYDHLASGNHEWKRVAANQIADKLMRHLFEA